MASVIDILLQGTLLGGLYALFAAGLSLMFGVMRLVNLAHGDIIVLAAFLILVAAQSLGMSTLEGAVLAIPVLFGVGFVLQVGLLNRVLGRDNCRRC
jgi:branched-chain amino acid transport system permease protein